MHFVLLLGTAKKNLNRLHLFYVPLHKILTQTGKIPPQVFLFSRLNNPVPITFVALHWTHSTMSICLLHWGVQNWAQYSRCVSPGLGRWAGSPFDLLEVLFLMQPGCCWPPLLWGHTTQAGSRELQEEMLQGFLLPGRWNKWKYLLLTWMLAPQNKKQHMALAAFPKAFTAAAMLYARNLIWQNIFYRHYFRQEFK